MDTNWAAENLHVIRTLMERSALYRRALAPIMFFLGTVGIVAGISGPILRLISPRAFVLYWGTVGLAALAGSFFLARKQAIKDSEPFWSPPTRHVSQALFPPIFVGGITGLLLLIVPASSWAEALCALLPAIWMILYGCALASAGFFMRQGIRVLGWVFVLIGCSLLVVASATKAAFDLQAANTHYLMGATFGVLHMACGIYLKTSKDIGDAL